jgi:hypothetical protein
LHQCNALTIAHIENLLFGRHCAMKRNRSHQAQPSIRNFFTAKKATGQPHQPEQTAENGDASHKRHKASSPEHCVIVLDDADDSTAVVGADAPAATAAAAAAAAGGGQEQQHRLPAAPLRSKPEHEVRDPAMHRVAQAKLVTARSSGDLDAAAAQLQSLQQQAPARGACRSSSAPKYTPLVCTGGQQGCIHSINPGLERAAGGIKCVEHCS